MRLGAVVRTWRVAAGLPTPEFYGGLILNGPLTMNAGLFLPNAIQGILTTMTYGAATIIPNAALGNEFVVTITDAVAFVVGAPINPPAVGRDQIIWLTFRNASGGAHGAGTWNAVYKTQAAVFAAIANGFSRTVVFRWNGTNWVEMFRSAADIAN